MKVYAAAGFGDLRMLGSVGYPNVLLAYEPARKAGRGRNWPYVPDHLFLDSGAYGAWSRGLEIDILRYANWVRAYSWHPSLRVANLDVIAGEPGRHPTIRERRQAAAEGARNAEILRAEGVPVIEVYHRFELLDVLAEICDRCDGNMMAFGGLVGGHDTNAKIRFCDAAWSYLYDRYDGNPPPVHGFGIGPDSQLGRRYRWTSLDATSWVAPSKFGHAVDGAGVARSGARPGSSRPDILLHMRVILDRWRRMEVD